MRNFSGENEDQKQAPRCLYAYLLHFAIVNVVSHQTYDSDCLIVKVLDIVMMLLCVVLYFRSRFVGWGMK